MKKTLLWLFIALLYTTHVFAAQELLSTNAYKVIKVTLDWQHVIRAAISPNWQWATLKNLMDSVGWVSAINAAYFAPTDYGRDKNFTWAARFHEWVNYTYNRPYFNGGAIFGFNSNGNPQFTKKVINAGKFSWTTPYEWISNFPILVEAGQNVLVDGSHIDAKMKQRSTKTFICNVDDHTVYMWQVFSKTIYEMPQYLIDTFSCYNAINLDAGGSLGMIYDGKTHNTPGRLIMDAFVVVEVWNKPGNTNNTNRLENFNFNMDELQTAITWMYDEWLTIHNTIQGFWMHNHMTREHAAKFFGVFATMKNKKLWIEPDMHNTSCIFSDIKNANKTLWENIYESCQLWIFKWNNGKFRPKNTLTNAQAITVLMRIVVGQMEEPKLYYIHYLNKAKELGIVSSIDVSKNITRWEAAILIYRARSQINKEIKSNVYDIVNADTTSFLWVDPNKIPPELLVKICSSDEYVNNEICMTHTRSCTITNGKWKQSLSNQSRSNCFIISCDYWYTYQIKDNICSIFNKQQNMSINQCEWDSIEFGCLIDPDGSMWLCPQNCTTR